MPIESAPIFFAANDLEFGCLCFLSLDWHGLLTADVAMAPLDAWAWRLHLGRPLHCQAGDGRRKNVRLKDAADLRRFFATVARFTPTEKMGRRRTLWIGGRQRLALRLLHTPTPDPNGNGTLSSAAAAALARVSPDRAALEVPSSSGGGRAGGSNSNTHQRWPIVKEVVEEGEGEVNPRTTFIVRLPGTASRAPSYATLLRKQQQKQEQEQEQEEEEKFQESSSSSERRKRLSLSTRSVVSTETQTTNTLAVVYPPPLPPPPPPPSLFQTPTYRRPLLLKKKKGVIGSEVAVAPCLLQASLLDELKSNFRSGIFIPPVRPKLPPAIIATLARNATLKRVASTASLPLSPLSRSISEASKSSSSSFSSTKSVKGKDDDDEDEAEEEVEEEDGADDYENRNTGGGDGASGNGNHHPLTLFEELQNFIRFGRLRHVEPRVKQVATTTFFNEDSFSRFRYPVFQRMVSAPALLPSPYFPARAARQGRTARSQEEEEEGGSDDLQLENNHHQQKEEEEEKKEEKDIYENPPPPSKQKTFILRPQKTPPPPPPLQIIQYHPFPPLEDSEVKVVVVDPDGNNNNGNNRNAQFRACQLTLVPCAEHGTDLVVQQEQQHQDPITPEKTPLGLLTGQPCRRALSFGSDDHQADDGGGGEEEEDYTSSNLKNISSSSKEPLL
ncbi:hypothetical protein TYRP_013831 [Tyrophagus putrescentiae]|nr:hypothetical protein TYRP_013831 [Tyrophagus putrescentiae]